MDMVLPARLCLLHKLVQVVQVVQVLHARHVTRSDQIRHDLTNRRPPALRCSRPLDNLHNLSDLIKQLDTDQISTPTSSIMKSFTLMDSPTSKLVLLIFSCLSSLYMLRAALTLLKRASGLAKAVLRIAPPQLRMA